MEKPARDDDLLHNAKKSCASLLMRGQTYGDEDSPAGERRPGRGEGETNARRLPGGRSNGEKEPAAGRQVVLAPPSTDATTAPSLFLPAEPHQIWSGGAAATGTPTNIHPPAGK